MSWPYGETIVVIRRAAATNPYSGQLEPGLGTETRRPVPGCGIAPAAGEEPLAVDTPHRSTADVTVYAPHDLADVDVLPGDQIEVRGARYEVIGALQRWVSPLTGWRPGCVITGRRVEA